MDGPVDELPEGAEAAPREIQEAVQAADRARLGLVLDKASSDPGWRQQLLDDPEAALAAIGQTDVPDLGDVTGQSRRPLRTRWIWRFDFAGGWAWYHWKG